MTVNENILKLTGRVSIPEALELDINYSLALQGSITGKDERINHNGTLDSIWRFEPVKCEILTPMGKTLRAKDPRKMSQKLRSVMYVVNQTEDPEAYYERNMTLLIKNWEEIEHYLKNL